MLDRRGKQSRYSREQTLDWLRWLGSSLLSQRQSVFHLEDLGPEWLSTRSRQRWARPVLPHVSAVSDADAGRPGAFCGGDTEAGGEKLASIEHGGGPP